MITAKEAENLSNSFLISSTMSWLNDTIAPAIEAAARLGHRKLYFSLYDGENDWERHEEEEEYYCPCIRNLDWDLVRNELSTLGYEITNDEEDPTMIVYISW